MHKPIIANNLILVLLHVIDLWIRLDNKKPAFLDKADEVPINELKAKDVVVFGSEVHGEAYPVAVYIFPKYPQPFELSFIYFHKDEVSFFFLGKGVSDLATGFGVKCQELPIEVISF